MSEATYSLRRTVAPTLCPVTLDEAKAHCRVQHAAEDALFDRWRKAAAGHVEGLLGRGLLTQTWRLMLDAFPAWEVRLPRSAELQSVSSLTYLDPTDGTSTALAEDTDYKVLADRLPARLVPAYGEVWPTARDEEDAVTITYVVGWSAESSVPEEIKQAVLMLVGHWFSNRNAAAEKPPAEIDFAVKALCAPWDASEYA